MRIGHIYYIRQIIPDFLQKAEAAAHPCAVCFRFTFPALSVLVKIFLSRCHPAPDVALGLVGVEDLAGLAGKGGVDLG